MTRKCERREKENSLTASSRHLGSNLAELMGSTRLEIEICEMVFRFDHVFFCFFLGKIVPF